MAVSLSLIASDSDMTPLGWQIIPLESLMTFHNGVNASKTAYGTGIPFINVLEVITNPKLDISKIPGRITLPPEIASAFKVRDGDVFFNRTSETDHELALASVFTGQEEVVYGGFVIRGRPSGTQLSPKFASYILRISSVRTQIVSRGQGAVRSNIGQQELGKVLIPLPPKAEQEAIATALSDADALIESLEQLIAKKRQIKQGAMVELLTGKRRLPGFEDRGQSKTSEIPKNWEICALGKYVKVQGGYSFSSSAFCDIGIPVVRISNVQDGRVDLSEAVYHQPFAISPEFVIKEGDPLIAMSGATTGKVGVYRHNIPAYQNQRVGKFVALSLTKTSISFVNQLVSSNIFLKKLSVFLEQGAQPNISSKQLEALIFKFPTDRVEQQAISDFLDDMESEIAVLQSKLTKARQLKQGMMQELLTGRIRLI
jgi:type I restriction enzyme S subunit